MSADLEMNEVTPPTDLPFSRLGNTTRESELPMASSLESVEVYTNQVTKNG